MNLELLKETDKYYYLTWTKDSSITYYKLLGMNSLFEYEEIKKYTQNTIKIKKEALLSFISIKIDYSVLDQDTKEEIILYSSNNLKIDNNSFETITVKRIKSFQGITFSFQHNELFDKYILYEKRNDKKEIIRETEDFQVTIKNYNKDSIYQVEAYNNTNNKYILKAISDDFSPTITESCTNQPKSISIVIPVYNSELFLSRCIDSILLSSIKDFEIILIDDGSKDDSKIIMEWYERNYNTHIKCIYKENEGVSKTRNRGIKEATKEYIAFVDDDDLVHPYMYENLLTTAINNNSSIVIGKTLIRNDINNTSICLNLNNNVVYDYNTMLKEKNNSSINNIFFVAVWNKIIKTSLVKPHPFPEDNYYEDTAFTRMIYSYIDEFSFNKDAYYIWDKRIQKTIGTATNTYFNDKKEDPLFYQKKYRDAIFYCIEKGNKEKIKELIYDSIKEAYDYLKSLNRLDTKNEIRSLYNEEINNLYEKYNLLQNPYIAKDIEIYQYIMHLIIEKDF